MATTKQNIPRLNLTKGMSITGPTYQVPEGFWRETYGFRFVDSLITQMPRKKEWVYVEQDTFSGTTGYYPHRVNGLVNLGGEQGCGKLIAMTPAHLFRLTSSGFGRLSFAGNLAEFPTSKDRWGMVANSNLLYFTRPGVPICSTDGDYITLRNPLMSGQYLDVFYDHLVVGRTRYKGREDDYTIHWSHLRDFGNFEAKTFTEADRYRIIEHQRTDSPIRGVTGIGRIRDSFFVYTPEGIYAFSYVGLPKVLNEGHAVLDHGCGFKYGLACFDNTHYFPSWTEKTFYAFDGQSIRDIGTPISATFFTEVLGPNDVFNFIDPRYNEIWWILATNTNWEGIIADRLFGKAYVYNMVEGTWYTTYVEDISAFCLARKSVLRVDDVTGTFDSKVGTRVNDVEGQVLPEALYGSDLGLVLREEISTDTLATLLTVPDPYLRTPHNTYESSQFVKEADTVTIHANYVSANGVQTWLDRKNNLTAADSYVRQQGTNTKLWTTSTKDGRYTFPRIAGRAFSYKFLFEGTAATQSVRTARIYAGVQGAPAPSSVLPATPTTPETGGGIYDPSGERPNQPIKCIDTSSLDFSIEVGLSDSSTQYTARFYISESSLTGQFWDPVTGTFGVSVSLQYILGTQGFFVVSRFHHTGSAWVADGVPVKLTDWYLFNASRQNGAGDFIDPVGLVAGTWYGYLVTWFDGCGRHHYKWFTTRAATPTVKTVTMTIPYMFWSKGWFEGGGIRPGIWEWCKGTSASAPYNLRFGSDADPAAAWTWFKDQLPTGFGTGDSRFWAFLKGMAPNWVLTESGELTAALRLLTSSTAVPVGFLLPTDDTGWKAALNYVDIYAVHYRAFDWFMIGNWDLSNAAVDRLLQVPENPYPLSLVSNAESVMSVLGPYFSTGYSLPADNTTVQLAQANGGTVTIDHGVDRAGDDVNFSYSLIYLRLPLIYTE